MRWAKFVGNENELNKFECKAQSFTHKDKMEKQNGGAQRRRKEKKEKTRYISIGAMSIK